MFEIKNNLFRQPFFPLSSYFQKEYLHTFKFEGVVDSMNIELSILKTVAYFDVFKYPLSKDEIGYFLDQKYDDKELNSAINNLIKNDVLFHLDDFYSLSNDETIAVRRIEGNNAATAELKKAKKVAKFLYKWFPFIRGIAISGSLSKNFAYKDSDFDFFVITSANRLWISRFIFVMFHRIILLFGFENMFCLNYMIDENAFEIVEKNIYTAIEIATLIPCNGCKDYNNFFNTNSWIEDFLPNYFIKPADDQKFRSSFIKRIIERLLNNSFGDRMNTWILNFCKRRWKKLFAKNKYSKTGFRLGGVIADTHIFKPLPQLFQKKVITSFNERFLNAKKMMTEKMYFDTGKSILRKSV